MDDVLARILSFAGLMHYHDILCRRCRTTALGRRTLFNNAFIQYVCDKEELPTSPALLCTLMAWNTPPLSHPLRRKLDLIDTARYVFSSFQDTRIDDPDVLRTKTLQNWRNTVGTKMYRVHFMRMPRYHHSETPLSKYIYITNYEERKKLFEHTRQTHVSSDVIYGRHVTYRSPKWVFTSRISLQCRALVY